MARTMRGKRIHLNSKVGADGRQGDTQDHGRDDGDFVRLEDVGSHAGAVANVVADQVSDDGGVARIVFGQVFLDLADQVGAHVSGLGVDAAANAHEEGDQGAAEAEAQQNFWSCLAVDDEDDRAAKQAQAIGQHAGDRAGAVADAQGVAEAAARCRSNAHVAQDGHAHADLADQQREDGAHEEGAGAAKGDGQAVKAGLGDVLGEVSDQSAALPKRATVRMAMKTTMVRSWRLR